MQNNEKCLKDYEKNNKIMYTRKTITGLKKIKRCNKKVIFLRENRCKMLLCVLLLNVLFHIFLQFSLIQCLEYYLLIRILHQCDFCLL